MIPHIVHYCWFGKGELPQLAKDCIASWHRYMPEWQYVRWDESNFDISSAPLYVRQAYETRKFAFVSDYVRLWALEQYGGLYMDVDFEVYRPFDELMNKYPAFAGYEGSKRMPVMQGVIASEAHGAWVTDMLRTYNTRVFIKEDGSLDMTPNTTFFSDRLEAQGFIADGVEKDFYLEQETKTQINSACADINIENTSKPKMNNPQSSDDDSPSLDPKSAHMQASGQPSAQSCANSLPDYSKNNDSILESQKNPQNNDGKVFMLHVFPVHYFCPVLTTGEDVRTEETYCEHLGESSWATNKSWKAKVLRLLGPKWKTRIIKMKRKLLG